MARSRTCARACCRPPSRAPTRARSTPSATRSASRTVRWSRTSPTPIRKRSSIRSPKCSRAAPAAISRAPTSGPPARCSRCGAPKSRQRWARSFAARTCATFARRSAARTRRRSGLDPLNNDFLLHPPRPDVFGDREVTSVYAEVVVPLVTPERGCAAGQQPGIDGIGALRGLQRLRRRRPSRRSD
jgi:hypothetical protein